MGIPWGTMRKIKKKAKIKGQSRTAKGENRTEMGVRPSMRRACLGL
jgi:hypothetical protein